VPNESVTTKNVGAVESRGVCRAKTIGFPNGSIAEHIRKRAR